jgi:uncharacterized YigZ family protein
VYAYKTIQSPAEGLYKEKGSKFLGFAYPVDSEFQIKEILASLHKKYYDARHHCYAWTLGPEKKLYRAFDDGEPNHSAGNPILGQIRSKDLTNVLIVVVRYFGGIKLGVGGLATAYKTAAEESLKHAIIVQRDVVKTMALSFDYSSTPEVMRLVKDFELTLLTQEFGDTCTMRAEFKLLYEKALFEKIALLQKTGTKVEILQR